MALPPAGRVDNTRHQRRISASLPKAGNAAMRCIPAAARPGPGPAASGRMKTPFGGVWRDAPGESSSGCISESSKPLYGATFYDIRSDRCAAKSCWYKTA